jgi:hypothetical protein
MGGASFTEKGKHHGLPNPWNFSMTFAGLSLLFAATSIMTNGSDDRFIVRMQEHVSNLERRLAGQAD